MRRFIKAGPFLLAGKLQVEELYGIMHFPSHSSELSFSDIPLLEEPHGADPNGLVPFIAGQVRVWSQYYRSSFYFGDAAGQGSYGEVWRGYLTEEGVRTKVVLKRIFAHKGLSVISAAMREVYYGSMLGQHRHHLSRLISHFVEDHDLWLVFHDEGISLYQAIFYPVYMNGLSMIYRSSFWEQTRADPSITVNIVKQVLLGLEELHSMNITHRDIKLENILIDPKTLQVRIGDFGSAARGSDDPHLQASLFPPTGPSLAEETSRYASPERLANSDLLIHPSYDIWCVGIMWLEMFLGSVDLGFEDRRGLCVREVECSDLAARIKSRDLLKIGITDGKILDAILKLLALKPEERPTATEALEHPVFASTSKGKTMYHVTLVQTTTKEPPRNPEIQSWKAKGGRAEMEDELVVHSKNDKHLACVFDGHNGGRISSFLAQKLPKYIFAENESVSLAKAVDKLIADVDGNPEIGGIEGSTIACVLVDAESGEVHAANIGDSRVLVVESMDESEWKPSIGSRVKFGSNQEKSGYVVDFKDSFVIVTPDGQENRRTVARNAVPESKPVRARQITVDHKPDNPAELTFIEAHGGFVSGNPPRVNGTLAISRSVGVKDLSKILRREPDLYKFRITKSLEKIVVATDGIWDVLSNQVVAELCYQGARAIVDKALEIGGRDNMAVIVVDLERGIDEDNRKLHDEL